MRMTILAVAVAAISGSAGAQVVSGPTTQPATATAVSSVRNPLWAEPLTIGGVPNLHRVTPNLYRSAQPSKEGMQNLKALGIKTVISLRSFHDDDDELEGIGLQQFEIPMKTWHAEREDAVRFLKLATEAANQPVLVHCQHGADRTGTMCAVYRMAVQGWTKEQAVSEMTDGGYGFHEIWSNLKSWLDKVDVQELRREVGIQ